MTATALSSMTPAEFNAFCARVDAEADEARRGGFVSGDALRKGDAAVAEANASRLPGRPVSPCPDHPGCTLVPLPVGGARGYCAIDSRSYQMTPPEVKW
jgi:hypothetical protein